MTDIAIVKGSTYRDVLRWATAECVFVQATLVPGAPVRLSATAHGIPDGWPLVYVEGSTNIEPTRAQAVRVVNADTLEIPCLNGTKFKAGSVVLRVFKPVELAGYQARMQIRDRIGGTVLLELSSFAIPGDPRIILDDVAKTITREIPAAVTADLSWKRGVFDLEMVIGTDVTKIESGAATTQDEVTK